MKSSLQKTEQSSQIITRLKEAQRQGILSGFYGRLGDLGTIDQKYDCAVTTACSTLESMVVESTTAAEKCIQFLRENRVGRASFICLDRVQESLGR